MKAPSYLQQLTIIVTGLSAGVLYCWSVSVTKGLAPLQDKEYIYVFQSLNREIKNVLFAICFAGPVLLLPFSAWLYYKQRAFVCSRLLLLSAFFYVAGVIMVTMLGNIPLNDSLEAFSVLAATKEVLAAKRFAFEESWNHLHTIRTLSAVFSFVFTVRAAMIR